MSGFMWVRPGVPAVDLPVRQDMGGIWRGGAAVERAEAARCEKWLDAQVARMPKDERARVVRQHERAGGFESQEANKRLMFEARVFDALRKLPWRWSQHLKAEHRRMGGAGSDAANALVFDAAAAADGGVPLAASDADLRALAKSLARDAQGLIARKGKDADARHITAGDVLSLKKVLANGSGENAAAMRQGMDKLAELFSGGVSVRSIEAMAAARRGGGRGAVLSELMKICERFDVRPPVVDCAEDALPAIKRMCCARWWLRGLRRAHARRAEGLAIKAGLVRRGLWIYSTQDAVERRQEQRRRNAKAINDAVLSCVETGGDIDLGQVVAASVANPEVKRAELMTRIKGCDAIAHEKGFSCEFWTLTTPSRFHAARIEGGKGVKNEAYNGATPADAQQYLVKLWARVRAAWKRSGLEVFGLRTAEPHHDGTPHWHLIVYGRADELRIARWQLKRHALRDSGFEEGAKEHRFKWLAAEAGTRGAAYAAKYVSKNIDGKGLEDEISDEDKKKISASVKRVDAWAANWGVRQFQFFGCPKITAWRVLRRFREPVAVRGAAIERARAAADTADFAEYWRACEGCELSIVYRNDGRLTAYGDEAAPRVVGVEEGGRRAMLPEKTWVISWEGKKLGSELARVFALRGGAGVGVGVGGVLGFGGIAAPRSCVNNCTGPGGLPHELSGGDDLASYFFWEKPGGGIVDKVRTG